MNVTAIQKTTLDLDVYKTPFKLTFSWNKKRGVNEDYWFTPSGDCKIWTCSVGNNHIGHITKAEYDSLLKRMRKAKTDILTDGRDFYSIGDVTIMELRSVSNTIDKAMKEWELRKDIESWEEK